jgi:hypothetical protein
MIAPINLYALLQSTMLSNMSWFLPISLPVLLSSFQPRLVATVGSLSRKILELRFQDQIWGFCARNSASEVGLTSNLSLSSLSNTIVAATT